MQSLLRWSIENSETGAAGQQPQQPQQPKNLDPGVIDMILGKPDSELMKENLAIAVDEKRGEDERVEALDNFEMLIEHIDNANDLAKLKMWEPLQELLTSPSSSDEIKRQTLWIIGTAVQNNPASQNAYLSMSPMKTLLSFLEPAAGSAKTRSKAVYALSGLLKHSTPAVRQLQEANGWDALRTALEDSDITVRRKVAFLLNALLVPTSPSASRPPPSTTIPAAAAPSGTQTAQSNSVILHPTESNHAEPVHPNSHSSMADPGSFSTSELARDALEQHGLLQALLDALTAPVPHGPNGDLERDAEFEEKVVGVLHTYVVACGGALSADQKAALRGYVQAVAERDGGDQRLAESWGMSAEEVRQFRRALE